MLKFIFSLKSPLNLSYWWNLGSLLMMLMGIQVITGLLLTLYYDNSSSTSFNSLWLIHLDSFNGAYLHTFHLNFASFLFFFLFMHMMKGVYFGSFSAMALVWVSGWAIMMIMMMIAFLGYVLPWGQMSLWGATVITNLVSAFPVIGIQLVQWIWGGFFVSNFTMKLFFSIHFIMPFICVVLIIIHILILHIYGSSNPVGGFNSLMKEEFNYVYLFKDLINLNFLMLMMILSLLDPYLFGDPENFVKATPMVSPIHIQPEWYFLQYYAILRAIPNKLGGIIFFVLSLLMLAGLSFMTSKFMFQSMSMWKLLVSMFFISNLLLMWLGGCPVEEPYLAMSVVLMIVYFMFFISSIFFTV